MSVATKAELSGRTNDNRQASVEDVVVPRRLYVEERRTLAEIAAALGCSVTTVRRRVAREGMAPRTRAGTEVA